MPLEMDLISPGTLLTSNGKGKLHEIAANRSRMKTRREQSEFEPDAK